MFLNVLDKKGETIASLSSIDKSLKFKKLGNKCHQALIIGQTFGEILIKKGIKKALFDRGSFKYSGRISKLADGIRQSGVHI